MGPGKGIQIWSWCFAHFFADDLILFGEASEKQAGVMGGILSRFCDVSG